MTDIAINYNNESQYGDLALSFDDLVRDEGLESAVLISLFTDARAEPEEVPDSSNDLSGSFLTSIDGTVYGSKIWTLRRSKADNNTVQKMTDYARSALAWMVEDGVAGSIEAQAILVDKERIDLSVKIYKNGEAIFNRRFEDLWSAQFNPPTQPIV